MIRWRDVRFRLWMIGLRLRRLYRRTIDRPGRRKQFISAYVAAYCAGMYVKRSDEHLYSGRHPYTEPRDVPIEDAYFMAQVAWAAYTDHWPSLSTRKFTDEELRR